MTDVLLEPDLGPGHSNDSERRFHERVAELGGAVVNAKWRGVRANYLVLCSEGHECNPRADSILGGRGLCRACARSDRSLDAERRFRARLADLGATLVELKWLGTHVRHRVVCAAGHECSPLPSNVLKEGRGVCRFCARQRQLPERSSPPVATRRRPDPVDTCRRFRERIEELGGVVVEPVWLGARAPHRVVCAAGHECSPHPTNVLRGTGPCLTCAGRNPTTLWRSFLERVEALGGSVLEAEWLGSATPHRVTCARGHEVSPTPNHVQRGGLCLVCARSSSDAFYVVADEAAGAIKIGITTGDGSGRLCAHRRDGFETMLRFLPGLDDAAFLEQHTLKTLTAAGIDPVRGLEYFDQSALAVVLDVVDNWVPKAL